MLLKPVKIMVVDDDPLVRDFAVHTIEYSMDRKIEICESGFTAWQKLELEPRHADIIIADASLPEMNGFELLERVKARMPQKKVIITVGDPSLEQRASELGADAFIIKPFQADDLLRIIEAFALDDPERSQPQSLPDHG